MIFMWGYESSGKTAGKLQKNPSQKPHPPRRVNPCENRKDAAIKRDFLGEDPKLRASVADSTALAR
jgi:hypothetical protein